MNPLKATSVLAFLVLTLLPAIARGHAFPVRSEPRVGWTVTAPPATVKIWFDSELESAFSTITVYNALKKQVDRGNSHVDPADSTILAVDLLPLTAGTYRVYWSVLAKDTHVTTGDFSFTVKGKLP